MHECFGNPAKIAKTARRNGTLTTVYHGEQFRLVIDNKTGELRQKASLMRSNEGMAIDYYCLDVKRTMIKDDWQIPIEYVYTKRNPISKKISAITRVKIVPESVKINQIIREFDAGLQVRFPAWTRVDDHVNSVRYMIGPNGQKESFPEN